MIAIELLLATLFSSIVGSMHCVGMCTPFAILSMGPLGNRSKSVVRLTSYHAGRLFTYLLMGMGVAVASSIANGLFGGLVSFPIVGWLVGLSMIGVGILRLLSTFSWKVPVRHSQWSQRWTGMIIKLRRSYSRGPVWVGAFLWGLTSTLLPCGWLYVFVLAAAAAPSFAMTLSMMVAFWLGTLPLLSAVAWGWSSISPRWQAFAQPFAAGCIISFGVFILFQRSMVELRSAEVRQAMPNVASTALDGSGVIRSRTAMEMIQEILETPLPCCRGNDDIRP